MGIFAIVPSHGAVTSAVAQGPQSSVPLAVRRRGHQRPTKFATVVTDLTTCHNTWFHPGVTKCFVASEYTWQKALRLGLKPSQVRCPVYTHGCFLTQVPL